MYLFYGLESLLHNKEYGHRAACLTIQEVLLNKAPLKFHKPQDNYSMSGLSFASQIPGHFASDTATTCTIPGQLQTSHAVSPKLFTIAPFSKPNAIRPVTCRDLAQTESLVQEL